MDRASDVTACMALRFCTSRGIVPGKDIAVIGFDDTEEAFTDNLTSYNFNVPGYVSSMLAHLLEPSSPARSVTNMDIELDGIVIQRQSTIPPNRSGECVNINRRVYDMYGNFPYSPLPHEL
jgi:DNA-binding LacI/PurR family transcriptional regulator